MTLSEFGSRISKRLNIPRKEALRIYREIMAEGRDIVEEGDEFPLPGFGKAYYVETKAYKMSVQTKDGTKKTINIPRQAVMRLKFVRHKKDSVIQEYSKLTRTV